VGSRHESESHDLRGGGGGRGGGRVSALEEGRGGKNAWGRELKKGGGKNWGCEIFVPLKSRHDGEASTFASYYNADGRGRVKMYLMT